ncbi:glutaminyl-tRNA synthetase [Sodiomyces alkalinus F11]|uniref:glutamine--tRNA ligase n=1 Tax=Sodiomyces alkalinus (strain CBS 110278 / VKM F-3762 / F11) TaxID=1314773 RepID=A0A3N2Q562_SODAK|nr:glutaminyl-tRNA synthetase [Sodiomyces alkalinus F11]ROT41914.1 glutaminyl-tRNA synthetase [Sodiomyces alkalinus F11]
MMADMGAVAEQTAKLHLDEETGELVSKGELKKRQAKRAKKAATAKAKEAKAAVAAAVGGNDKKPAPKPKEEEVVIDSEAMFKQGFLDDVFKERPMKPVVTRFPPEPNGFLHIGHAKAIAVNFGFAKYHGGVCYLRYDDTNPEKEEEKYFTAIQDMVHWLGFTPYKITHSSDNFQKLYDLAEKLITLEKAYVCHCDDTEIKLQRGGEKGATPRYRCEHASQTVEANLKKFRDMRDGVYKPREAFLRMKMDMEDGNPQMWDLAAYRIKSDTPHHRTGWDWKIYPTYDFTHGLCDSFEKITHSLCTTEFINSRQSYEWLNKVLGVYEPMQREYGRLNITGTVLSKRKIQKLVDDGHVRDWDDPRLFTLVSLRRRGVPPQAILDFISELGVTPSTTTIQIKRFEQSIRKYLERTVPRLMMVLDPIPVTIEDATETLDLELPFSPKDPAMGSHTVKFTPTVYIDRSDFREVDSKDYFRLAPGKTVGLMNAPYPIKATSFGKDEATGKVTEVRAVFDKEGKKPKAFITWVGTEGSQRVEARVHNSLFKSERPDDAEGGFLNDIHPESEVVYPDAVIESGIDEVKRRAPWPEAAGESERGKSGPEGVRFQAMRLAYFAMDSDSKDDKIVLNKIVSLKEDAGKN